MLRLRPHLLLLAALLAIPACATRPPASDPDALAEYQQNNDPLEPTNRKLFDVHNAIDRTVLRPVAVGYRDAVPQPVRTGLRNFLTNLRSPVVLVNDVLQANPRRAGSTLGRFVVNSTVGLGGLIDVASKWGVPAHTEDWGQTLAVWGVGSGPYLFIPVLGPSTVRDTAGFGLDLLVDPFFWFGQGLAVELLRYSRGVATVVDAREGLIDTIDYVNRTSLDPYSTYRSAYYQRRDELIHNREDLVAPVSVQGGAGAFGGGSTPGVSSSPTGAP